MPIFRLRPPAPSQCAAAQLGRPETGFLFTCFDAMRDWGKRRRDEQSHCLAHHFRNAGLDFGHRCRSLDSASLFRGVSVADAGRGVPALHGHRLGRSGRGRLHLGDIEPDVGRTAGRRAQHPRCNSRWRTGGRDLQIHPRRPRIHWRGVRAALVAGDRYRKGRLLPRWARRPDLRHADHAALGS